MTDHAPAWHITPVKRHRKKAPLTVPAASQPRPQRLPEDAALKRADGLGWFSLGLGAAEVLIPGAVAKLIGIGNTPRAHGTLVLLGLREIVAGLGILTHSRPTGWVWSRVAGDAIDLALLGVAANSSGTKKSRVAMATAAVLGVTALDILTGRDLVATPAKDTAPERAIYVMKSITINTPPQDAYARWRDFGNLPTFMAHLEAVEVRDAKLSRWRVKAPAGMTVEWDAEVIEDRPGELISWRSLAGADVATSGTVRFTPAPGARGTEVSVELQYSPPAGRIGAALAKLFGEEPAQQIGSDLRRFKQVLELGEVVHSDASIHRRPHPSRPAAKAVRPQTGGDT